jgi:uncharacterized membrane protein YqgA involved in biofilm formation
MLGTLINFLAIIVGGFIGILLGARISEKIKSTIISALGIFTLLYAISLFIRTENSLIVLGSLLMGVLVGEWLHIQEGVERLGVWLEARFSRSEGAEDRNRFIRGFLTTTLVFCIGPMAILGALEDGISGNIQTLVIKSVLDGFAAMAFASTLGIGVLFSSVMVLVYQGAISLLAGQIQGVMTDAMILELTATGGVILAGIAVSNLLELKKIRTASFIPALLFAPLIVFIITLFK